MPYHIRHRADALLRQRACHLRRQSGHGSEGKSEVSGRHPRRWCEGEVLSKWNDGDEKSIEEIVGRHSLVA
jgi:hypothetical protein